MGPSPLDWARRLGAQGYRPGNAIQFFQGDPYWFFGKRARSLQIPLDPNEPKECLPSVVNNTPIVWAAQTFNVTTAANNILSAQPNRVILIVQNLSPTNPIAVNFDLAASVSGSSPNFVSQGLLLLPGVTLFVDKWTPTGGIYLSTANAPTVAVQGYSSIGNVPNIAE